MLISRRVLVTVVLCLALLASAPVAGAGVTILSVDTYHFYGSMGDSFGNYRQWGGSGFHQDYYGYYWEPHPEDPYYDGPVWIEGGYTANVQTYVSSHRIGVYKNAHHWYSSSQPGPCSSGIGCNFRMSLTLEVTRPWLATMWYDYSSSYGGMFFRNLDTGYYPTFLLNGPPVLLDPGTYSFMAEGIYEWGGGSEASGGIFWDGGIEFADPIPEPAYLSFVALAIVGLAAWRKRAKRLSV